MTNGGKDPGAIGYYVEKDINLQIGLACKNYLEKYGVEVKISRGNDIDYNLENRIDQCNSFEPDLAVDIHSNSGGGDGFEVFYFSGGGTSLDLAKNIETEVINIGQNSRGCKTKLNNVGTDYFGFIRETIAPAVILECAFLDNQKDVEIINSVDKLVKFGEAYAKGILKTLAINYNNISSSNDPKYYVQVGCYGLEENARKQLQKAKDAGFTDAFIKRF